MSKVEKYIESILNYVELNEENKSDIKEEVMFHINKKVELYLQGGYSKEQAIETAMSDFGEISKVGEELNREIIPFRKSLLTLIGFSGVLFSLLVCIFIYVYHETIPYIWFSLTLISTISIFYFVQKPSRAAANRLILISLLLLTFLFNFYGYLLLDSLMQNPLIYYSLFALFILNSLIIFSQIYAGAMFQPTNVNLKMISKEKRRITLLTNIFTGIIVLGVSLFIIIGYIIFAPSSIPVVALILIVSWSCLLLFQLRFKKMENLSRFLMIVLSTSVLVWFIYIQFGF